MAAGPLHCTGSGGIDSRASSLSRPMTLATSPRRNASTNRSTTVVSCADRGREIRSGSGCRAEPGAGADKRTVDGRRGRAEDLGGLVRREAEDVAEHQDHALLGGELLQPGDEGQGDGLARVVARFGAEFDRFEQCVWIWLQPPRIVCVAEHRRCGPVADSEGRLRPS